MENVKDSYVIFFFLILVYYLILNIKKMTLGQRFRNKIRISILIQKIRNDMELFPSTAFKLYIDGEPFGGSVWMSAVINN